MAGSDRSLRDVNDDASAVLAREGEVTIGLDVAEVDIVVAGQKQDRERC